MDNLGILEFGSAFVVLVIFVVLYYGMGFILKRQTAGNTDGSLLKQSVLFLIATVGAVAFLLTLPLEPDTKDRITTLLGYMISAIVALSSATFFGNMLAGILLRIINNFKPGDFIEVKEHLGRISERGLFHTELQTNDRNLITLPNLYLATNPVKVTRSSGTFISTKVSLGYDVSRLKIEQCLIEAAKKTNLTDPFVYITELGDFSVVYKIHGKQEDVKRVLSATSKLNAMVLDELHAAKIEIVSPNFMNQRQVGDAIFIPQNLSNRLKDLQQNLNADMLVFDKAEQAETIEERKQRIERIDKKIKELNEHAKKGSEHDQAEVAKIIERYKEVRNKMEKSLESKVEEFKETDKS